MNKKQQESLKANLREQPEEYLQCRDMRHSWYATTGFFLAEEDNRIIRELVCVRCGVARRDSFSLTRDGRLVRYGTSYAYPDGYLMKGVPRGNKSQDVIRGEIYRRTLAFALEANAV